MFLIIQLCCSRSAFCPFSPFCPRFPSDTKLPHRVSSRPKPALIYACSSFCENCPTTFLDYLQRTPDTAVANVTHKHIRHNCLHTHCLLAYIV